MSNIPAEFDEIRPYSPEELPQVFEELIADPNFQKIIHYIFPSAPFEVIANKMRQCKTSFEFQKAFSYNLIKDIEQKCSKGVTINCKVLGDDKQQKFTFISNHRDIILDSGFLSVLLLDEGRNTVEIAIGDNLLIYPWIKKLVRINKSFIVQRALTMRQMLESSARLSRYMHYDIQEKHENIWIAQREGRAKDSNDRTQDSILKMMTMGGEGNIIDRLVGLHIVPLAISYEYDPCDYLKAKEFQLKRDIPDYKKTTADDLLNMQTGLMGYKGFVHFQTDECLDTKLMQLDIKQPKQELFTQISALIDKGIHKNYKIYPNNYIAYNLLKKENRFSDKYTKEEETGFKKYLKGQLDKIDLEQKDETFLMEKMLIMYANPLINYLAATKEE